MAERRRGRPGPRGGPAVSPRARQARAKPPGRKRARPRVAILLGSESDRATMEEGAAVLARLGVESEVRVLSAHRSPEALRRYVRTAPGRGIEVFIAGAGMAAHLAGAVAAQSTLPVIGVPLAGSALQGLDALLATVQMPAGVPVATMAIGLPGAKNAGWLAASILALDDSALAAQLVAERRRMAGPRGPRAHGRI